jgi:hypothetical protein
MHSSNALPGVHHMLDITALWPAGISVPVTPTESDTEPTITGEDLQLYAVDSKSETGEPNVSPLSPLGPYYPSFSANKTC